MKALLAILFFLAGCCLIASGIYTGATGMLPDNWGWLVFAGLIVLGGSYSLVEERE